MAHREVGGIHHMDVVKLLRRQARVLVAAGKSDADVEVNHRVVSGGLPGEERLIVPDAHGVGGGDVTAGIHMGGNVRGGDVLTVPEELTAFDDTQRNDGNMVLLQQLRGQITGAVRGNFDHRGFSFPFHMGRMAGGIISYSPVQC